MINHFGELLHEHECLYGVICRDATLTDIELMAQAGYHIVWLDLEHGPQSRAEALRLTRTLTHLGMVPLVRIPELLRTHVQVLLDGGVQIVTLPDVREASQVVQFVQLGKYPPLGQRGVSTSSAGTGYTLGPDPQQALREANDATHLMVMIESDEGYDALDAILEIEGVDMVTVGLMDWCTHLGIYGEEAKASLTPKVERVLKAASKAGKVTAMGVFSAERARRYLDLGVRVFFVGVDVAIKRKILAETLVQFQDALGAS